MTDRPRRRSAKVLFHDPDARTLLFEGFNPSEPAAGTWWFAPGGGLEPGESHEQAAIREVFEETGQRIDDLGSIVAKTRDTFRFMDRLIDQETVYFTKPTEPFEVDRSRWTDLERSSIKATRWWALAELKTTAAVIWPENIVELLTTAISEKR